MFAAGQEGAGCGGVAGQEQLALLGWCWMLGAGYCDVG